MSMLYLKAIKGLYFLMQLNNIHARGLACIKTPLFNVVGGFANNNYWSSSENDSNNAWNQFFNYSYQYINGNKLNQLPVRAVRAF